MIKVIKNLILAILVLSLKGAYAAYLSYEQVYKTLNSRIYTETRQKLSGISEDFKIKITGIPNENYNIADSTLPKIEIISQNNTFSPNSYKRVIIKDSKNNIVKAFPINVQTLVYSDVAVANSIIGYNKEIKPEDITIEKREISKYLGKTYPKYEAGLVASRNFQKGNLILSDYVKTKSVIEKNSIVKIIFLSDKGLRITLQGKALKEGGIGDTIPVKSDKYNKVYNAKISSSNEVMVRI